jgi:transposase-like protein
MRRIDAGRRPASREELAGWYSSVLEAQSRSGLSVADYAARVGVSAVTLYQWRRRLSTSSYDDHAPDRARLVEVTLARGRQADSAGVLVVRVRDGSRAIEVPRGFDSDDVRRLVTVLESC